MHEEQDHPHDHGEGHGHEHATAGGTAPHHRQGETGAPADHGAATAHKAANLDVATPTPLGPPKTFFRLGEDLRLATIDRGSGPAFLFLHGFPTSGALFRNVIREIEGAARCLAPDLPGFGETECPIDWDFGIEKQAEVVLGLLDRLGIERATVVGHDWGGAVAQILAARHHERIDRLVLVDCPAYDYTPPPALERFVLAARNSFIFDLLCDTGLLGWLARRAFRSSFYDPRALSEEAIDAYLAPLYRETTPFFRASRERMRRATLHLYLAGPRATLGAVDGIRRFDRPTLVVWAGDDPHISVSVGKKLAAEIPGCSRFEIIPFCGHFVPDERPAELATLIEDFAELKRPLAASLG